MRCDCCFLSCKPEARRQHFIEPNRGRSIPTGTDSLTFDVVIAADIGIASGIFNARPSRPSHQFGKKRTGGYKALLSSLQRACDSTRLGWRL